LSDWEWLAKMVAEASIVHHHPINAIFYRSSRP